MRHRSATRSASRGGNLSRISRYWAQAESFPSRRTTLPSTKKIFPHIGRVSAAWTLVWDRDTDTVYVSRTHRLRETLEGAGVALAAQYREQGLNLFVERIQPLRRRHGAKIGQRRGRFGHAEPDAIGALQSLQESQRLVGRVSLVSPQGRQGRQGRRRSDVRNTIRADDVAARLDSQVLSQLPSPNSLPQAGLAMSDRSTKGPKCRHVSLVVASVLAIWGFSLLR